MTPRNTSLASNNNSAAGEEESPRFKIFCDLDGVLCDFDAGIRRISGGKCPDELHYKEMWRYVRNSPNFYAHLPWTNDGKDLWQALLPLGPDILTGIPMLTSSRHEKASWCRRELQLCGYCRVNHVDMAGSERLHTLVKGRRQPEAVNVITCWSRNKHFESGPGRYVRINQYSALRHIANYTKLVSFTQF